MSPELKLYLTDVANMNIASDNDDFFINDYACGNIDDAYSMGIDTGEKALAKRLLEKFAS